MTDEKQRIIIDEDWKSQVQAERDAAERAGQAKPAEPAERLAPYPAASFEVLIGMLATQAAIALGAAQNPLTEQVDIDLDQARHVIDLLQVLEDKTAGNRTPEESDLLSRLLNELRMGFVAVKEYKETAAGADQAR